MTKKLKEVLDELQEIQKRSLEIRSQVESASEDELDSLETELTGLEERKKELLTKKQEIEEIEKEARQIADGEVVGTPIELPKGQEEERNMFGVETKEYRDAFYAFLQGEATEEQRAGLITTSTDGIALPKVLDDKIWDNIHTAHPILADISIRQTGVVLEVMKHTTITKGKAKKVAEGAGNDIEENTFVKVTLSGNDYSKTCELSYAAAKMSQSALEDYLAEEIGNDLAEALATDVFAQIKADIGAAVITVANQTQLKFAELAKAFGAVERGSNLKVYCSRANKYGQVVGMVDTAGQPVFRDGVALGGEVKEDSAAGNDLFVIDPTKFVLNMIQPIMIESDKDITAHKHIISGYCRAQGTMRDNKAAAYITFATE